ncbi:MAG TPA: ribosome maturation factor RimM [Acidimicrobiales bacterium]|nr:ribosome maturation factor RimM [Acidimicrobiales bacterium]
MGRIARPHGLDGHVLVELTTNRHERLDPGSRLYAAGAADGQGGPGRELCVATSSPHLGRWIVAFEGVTDRSGADELRGAILSAEPVEDPDALWVHELVGCRLVDQAGTDLGRIDAVQANPASDLLVLDGGGLVPLRFVTGHSDGVVVADVPEGLLE